MQIPLLLTYIADSIQFHFRVGANLDELVVSTVLQYNELALELDASATLVFTPISLQEESQSM